MLLFSITFAKDCDLMHGSCIVRLLIIEGQTGKVVSLIRVASSLTQVRLLTLSSGERESYSSLTQVRLVTPSPLEDGG